MMNISVNQSTCNYICFAVISAKCNFDMKC